MSGREDAPVLELVLRVSEEGGLDTEAEANRTRLLDYYRARMAGDPDAFANFVDPDLDFFQASGLPYGGEAKGAEGALKLVGAMFATWRKLKVEVLEITAGGDLVIAYLMLTGISRATGDRYHGPTAEVFRFRDGKVVEWRPIYWDTHAVRRACGTDQSGD